MDRHVILFLAANPLGTSRRALDREARAIQMELDASGQRDCFELVTRWAVEPLDLLRWLRRLQPTVVHFSGHGRPPTARTRRSRRVGGARQHGLGFQGTDGAPQWVTADALAQAFHAAGESVRLVVLSACDSDPHAEILRRHVDCVVGIGGAIDEAATRSFAIGFYGALGECASVRAAFLHGCAAIRLVGLPEAGQPRLRLHDGVDADRVVLAELPPPAERAVRRAALGEHLARWNEVLDAPEWSVLTPPFLFGRSLRIDECFADLHFIPSDQLSGRLGGGARDEHEVVSSGDAQTARFYRAQSVQSVLASLRRRTVMVGTPGAGKTTFLMWLARQIKLGKVRPFNTSAFISLAGYARELRTQPALKLVAFFFTQQLGVPGDVASRLADELVAAGAASSSAGPAIVPILLLDGWDEVPDDLRSTTLEAIRRDSRPFFTIITSRPSGIPRVFEEDWAALYEISSLSRPTVRQQVMRICELVASDAEKASILGALDGDAALLELCANPFMLTVFCAVLITYPRLSTRRITRAVLMEATLQLINEERAARTGARPLSDSDYAALGVLAHRMSFDPSGKRVSFARVELDEIRPPMSSRSLFDKIERSRLIDATAMRGEQYRFLHLRIQEYLAAVHHKDLTGRDHALGWQRTLAVVWQEEMKFLAALLADDRNHGLWRCLRTVVANHLDAAGFAVTRVGGIVAAAGCRDGGAALIGIDLRPRLWDLVGRWSEIGIFALNTLIELDEDYLGNRLRGPEGARLFETVSTFANYIPHRIVERFDLRGHARFWQVRERVSWLHTITAPTALSGVDSRRQRSQAADGEAPLERRLDAIYALGASRDPAAIPALSRCLAADDIDVFHAACQALMTIAGPRAAGPLQRALVEACRDRRFKRADYVAQALQPEQGGALEPASRDKLLVELATVPVEHAGVKYRLKALQGALIPAEGECLLAILQARSFDNAWAAAQLFEGVLDQGLMVRALDQALDHRDHLLRDAIIRAVRWVPRGYGRATELAQRGFDERFVSTGSFLDLCARTLRVVPAHPMIAHCTADIAALYDRWPDRMSESVQLSCVEAADVLVGATRQATLLRAGMAAYRSSEHGETLAFSSALMLWHVEGADASTFMVEYLLDRLADWVDDFMNIRNLFAVIIGRLASHDPAAILRILRRLDELRPSTRSSAVGELRDCTLYEAALRGLLIYPDLVLDRSGRSHSL
jgi:NACHT domain/CHAT domain